MQTETSIPAYFADLEAPRVERNRKHLLMNILTIAILGVVCGALGQMRTSWRWDNGG